MGHVSPGPPLIPDGRIARVRLAAAAFPRGPSQTSRGLSARSHTPLGWLVIPPARRPLRLSPLSGSTSRRCSLSGARHLPRAPLHPWGVTPRVATSRPRRQALPRPRRSYWLMRPTKSLPVLGPLARSFPPVLVPVSSQRASASPSSGGVRLRVNPCDAISTHGDNSRLQSFLDVQAPTLARPPDCAHR